MPRQRKSVTRPRKGASRRVTKAGKASRALKVPMVTIRINEVVGDMTCAKIASRTNAVPETVRRYVNGDTPSIEWVIAFCKAFGVSADWLLTGAGKRGKR